jgi:hypothetical protein
MLTVEDYRELDKNGEYKNLSDEELGKIVEQDRIESEERMAKAQKAADEWRAERRERFNEHFDGEPLESLLSKVYEPKHPEKETFRCDICDVKREVYKYEQCSLSIGSDDWKDYYEWDKVCKVCMDEMFSEIGKFVNRTGSGGHSICGEYTYAVDADDDTTNFDYDSLSKEDCENAYKVVTIMFLQNNNRNKKRDGYAERRRLKRELKKELEK